MASDADARPPRQLTPAFYGCYDWHSAVHGHWLLARLARQFPAAPFAAKARAALAQSLTPEHVAAEVAYMAAEGRGTFERPYGLAWLLQLSAELHEWDDPQARGWAAALEPLVETALGRLRTWLPKLSHPIRIGEHNQTAFSLGLILDWARATGDRDAQGFFAARARELYLADRACPLAYEPSGEDFLSPCLAEADLMRRILPPSDLRGLAVVVPAAGRDGAGWITPAVSPDPARRQARPSRRLEPLARLDARRDRRRPPRRRSAPEGSARRRRGASRLRPRRGDRRALRGRALAGELRDVLDDGKRPDDRARAAVALSAGVGGGGQLRAAAPAPPGRRLPTTDSRNARSAGVMRRNSTPIWCSVGLLRIS